MTTFWKYFFVVFFILAVPVAAYFGYRSYRSLKNPSSSAFNAIVPSTPVIIEFLEPSACFQKLDKNTDFWKELTSITTLKNFHEQVLYFDSVLSTNSQIKVIFDKYKLFVCLHPSVDGKIEPLFISELPSIGYKFTIENFIKEVNGEKSIVLQKKFLNTTISKLNIAGLERLFSFAVHKGIFIGSFEESLVRKAIEQMENGIPLTGEEHFKRLEIAAGKNVDANVYVNYSGFSVLAQALTSKSNQVWLQHLKHLGDWTGADLIIKPQELLITGYTITPGDGSQLLDQYRQEPKIIKIPEVLPFDVSLLCHFAFEDYYRHLVSRATYRSLNNLEKSADSIVQAMRKRMGLDVRASFYPWIGHEVAFALSGETGDGDNRKYVIIHATDIKMAADSLGRLADLLISTNKNKKYEEEFEDYLIRNLDIPGLFPVLFGSLFAGLDCPYYFTIRDYVVFANTPGALKYLITNFYVQKTLAVNPNFRSFSNGISDKSNIFFYCNTRKSLNSVTDFLSPGLAEEINNHQSTFKTFEGIAVQFSYTNDLFYTSIYLRYNPAYEEELSSGWMTEVAGNITGKPVFIRNEVTGKLNVTVFDDLNNMYLIDHFGKIIWKTPLIESPLSQAFQVDYFNNGKKQFCFNTPNYVYLIDRSGNYVGDFPVRLMAEATNGLHVLGDDQLLLALSDNRIYKFDRNIKPVDGWVKVSTSQKVKEPLEHLTVNEKNYYFITEINGNVTIVNDKGEARFKTKKGFKKAPNSKFYINQTNNKGVFITTDTGGKLIYIAENGKMDFTDFGDYSSDHYFLYEDFSQDGSNNFIFLDQNKLIVYDRFRQPLIEFEFPEKITIPPVFFDGLRNEKLLGVVSSTEGKVYLFNRNGQVYKDNNFTGNTTFITGSINNDGKLNLLLGDGNKLVNYLLK
jgi:hypothetical protein